MRICLHPLLATAGAGRSSGTWVFLHLRASSAGAQESPLSSHKEGPLCRPKELFSNDPLPLIHGPKRICTRME